MDTLTLNQWKLVDEKHAEVMDVSGLVSYNNSEGDKISSIFLFFQDEYQYFSLR